MELSCVAAAIILRVDDAALFRSTRRGDESAFCELFDRYQRRLYQYAAQMCGSAAADDIVQETFLAVLKADGFDSSIGTLAAYLFGIARHHVIRRLTKQGTLLESSYVGEMASPGPQETPFDVLAREEAIAAVRTAVQWLPPLYREVVVLCGLQEMDYATVADVINVPIGTVRSRLHRARALLAHKLPGDLQKRTHSAGSA
jgi:RNA polymerase sigma-70 factor, ECF subfamily